MKHNPQGRRDTITERKAAVFLWFDTEVEQAANFYAETFPDSAIENVIRVPDGVPGLPAGGVRVVEMTLLSLSYTLLNAGPHVQPTTPIPCRSAQMSRRRPTGSGKPLWATAEKRS